MKKSFIGLFLAATLLLLPALTHAQVRLPIKFHRQEHSLSCEVAALKMALGVHGIEKSEDILISHLPFDRTPKRNGIWGDPNQGFVGNIDGRMLIDGYGVYWDPIAQVANLYTKAEVITHGSASQVAAHLAAGNPVIIWGYYGAPRIYFWNTPEGAQIRAINGEHTIVVYGFDGTTQNPTRFYLMDPITGAYSWSAEQLMHNWAGLQHMGVVIKKPAN